MIPNRRTGRVLGVQIDVLAWESEPLGTDA
jgi:hypothetical protein